MWTDGARRVEESSNYLNRAHVRTKNRPGGSDNGVGYAMCQRRRRQKELQER